MLIAAHSVSAGVVGEVIADPILALLFGFILHFILDAIPHYDTTDGGKFTKRQLFLLALDGIVGLTILIFLFINSSAKLPFVMGILGGLLPDLLDNVPFWDKQFRRTIFGKRFHQFHEKIQSVKLAPLPGILIQYFISTVSIYIFFYLR